MERRSSQSDTGNPRKQAYNDAANKTQEKNEERMVNRQITEIKALAAKKGIGYEEARQSLEEKHNQQWDDYNNAVKRQKDIDEARMGKGYQ